MALKSTTWMDAMNEIQPSSGGQGGPKRAAQPGAAGNIAYAPGMQGNVKPQIPLARNMQPGPPPQAQGPARPNFPGQGQPFSGHSGQGGQAPMMPPQFAGGFLDALRAALSARTPFMTRGTTGPRY